MEAKELSNNSNNYQNNSRYKNGTPSKFPCNTYNQNNSSKPLICHYCGRPGHIRPNCRKLARDKTHENFKPTSTQANFTTSEAPSTNSINQDIIQWFIASVKDHSLDSHTWYLDSGATQI